MVDSVIEGVSLKGVATCIPSKSVDNQNSSEQFDPIEVKKIASLVGIKKRRVVESDICSSDLCLTAAVQLINSLQWSADTIDALIFVTQTPDYFLPSTASLIHRDLALPEHCAAFDVGLGCSGYPYGLWLGTMLIKCSTARRVLVLHGETPSRFIFKEDRSTALLFGDAGSATAIEEGGKDAWGFSLHSDGNGFADLIIPGGGFRTPKPENDRDSYLHMNGTNLFNFTAQKIPELIDDTMKLMGCTIDDIDTYLFHQSNQFLMRHVAKKCSLPVEKIPIVLNEYGNTGGPSVPLAMTSHYLDADIVHTKRSMLLGYGVGLSWGSALITINPETKFLHKEHP